MVLHHAGAAKIAVGLREHSQPYLASALASSTASGVELFFVLSGIVLLRPYLRQGRPLKPLVYVQRRVQRLWPPFLAAWLLAGLVTWLATQYPTTWTRGANLASFSVGSWLAQVGIVYVGSNPFNAAWWSLTVELLFYALVPLIVVLAKRFRPTFRQMLCVWIGCAVAALVAQAIPDSAVPAHLWPFPRFGVHLSCFATGTLIAAYDVPVAWAKRLVLLGLAYVALACAWPALNLHIGWGLFHFGVVVAALDEKGVLMRVLSRWPLVWLGERSYSLFLVHMSVFTIVSHALSVYLPGKSAAYFVLSRLIELPLSLFVAMLIFSFVERRFAHNLVSANAFWPSWTHAGKKSESQSALRAT